MGVGAREDRLRIGSPVSQRDAPTECHHDRLPVVVDEDCGGRRGELPVNPPVEGEHAAIP